MRTPTRWAIAVRRPDGSVHVESHDVTPSFAVLRRTVLRGAAALAEAIAIGSRAIAAAGSVASGATDGAGALAVVAVPLALAVLGVFVVLPGVVASGWTGIGADVAEAAGRAGVLAVYLLAVSRSPQAARLFVYHGAEHMAIAAFERAGRLPTREECRASSPVHVRCGSDFLALFVVAAGVVFSLPARRPLWLGAVSRVALVPVVAAVAYEVMRAAASDPRARLARIVTAPGRLIQRVTTKVPGDAEIEVALLALAAALGEAGPAPGGQPIPEGGDR